MESTPSSALDAIPVLVATFRRAVIAHGDGRFEDLSAADAAMMSPVASEESEPLHLLPPRGSEG